MAVKIEHISGDRSRMVRNTELSAANTSLTLSTGPGGAPFRLDKVAVKYSANTTVDITVTLDSGAGAAWDTLLRTISLVVAQNGIWIPDEELLFSGDDALIVVAPAGGGGVTAAISIYIEERGG